QALRFDSPASGRSFMLEIILKTSDVDYTPEILSWSVSASVKFEQREIITALARVGDGVVGRKGQRSAYNARDTRRIAKYLRAQPGIKIRYQDYRGYDFANVRILPPFSESDSTDEDKGTNETQMLLRFLNVE